MRRISIDELNNEMILAKPIYQGTRLILERDASHLTKHISQLENLGIFSVYIKDEWAKDISIPDAIREETREQCMNAVTVICERLKQ